MVCSKIRFPALVDVVDRIDPAARLPSPATPELGEILASWRGSQVRPLS
jgi:hypothetical protein